MFLSGTDRRLSLASRAIFSSFSIVFREFSLKPANSTLCKNVLLLRRFFFGVAVELAMPMDFTSNAAWERITPGGAESNTAADEAGPN